MLFGKLFIFKEHFLENYLIFWCLITTLRLFSGVWYKIFIIIYFLYNLKHVYYVNHLM